MLCWTRDVLTHHMMMMAGRGLRGVGVSWRSQCKQNWQPGGMPASKDECSKATDWGAAREGMPVQPATGDAHQGRKRRWAAWAGQKRRDGPAGCQGLQLAALLGQPERRPLAHGTNCLQWSLHWPGSMVQLSQGMTARKCSPGSMLAWSQMLFGIWLPPGIEMACEVHHVVSGD